MATPNHQPKFCLLGFLVAFVALGLALISFVYLFFLPSKPVLVQAPFTPTGAVKASKGRIFRVTDFGAYGDGIHDDTNAVNAALTAAMATGGGTVYFPGGQYLLTSTITCLGPISFQGESLLTSTILFAPTTDGARCLYFAGDITAANSGNPANYLYGCSVKNLRFDNGNSNVQKIAIASVNTSFMFIDSIYIEFWYGGSNPSIGLQVMGNNMLWARNINIQADRPISFEYNPAWDYSGSPWPGACLDQSHFENLQISTPLYDGHLIYVQPGSVLSNITFDGSQVWLLGLYGLYAPQLNGKGGVSNFSLSNLRSEQSFGHGIAGVNLVGCSRGTGYRIGDVLTVVDPTRYVGAGGTVTVGSVGSGGVVESVTLTSIGAHYSTGVKSTSGGSGSGCQVNITQLGDPGCNIWIEGGTNLNFTNCFLSPRTSGFKFRNSDHITLQNCIYRDFPNIALDIDSSCTSLLMQNCYFIDLALTNISGLTKMLGHSALTVYQTRPIGSVDLVGCLGGTGYKIGDILTIADHSAPLTDYPNGWYGAGGHVIITNVGPNGAVTGISLQSVGYRYSAGIKTTTGGSGKGCQVNISSVITASIYPGITEY